MWVYGTIPDLARAAADLNAKPWTPEQAENNWPVYHPR